MTFEEAVDLREDALLGMSLTELRELREADRVIACVADERFKQWQHEQAMLMRPLALVDPPMRLVPVPVALANVLADALITFVLRHREKPE
jgi:hypothetical protein